MLDEPILSIYPVFCQLTIVKRHFLFSFVKLKRTTFYLSVQ
ncbi:hypothetical protein ABIB30_000593 [Pedobacter sp. UYP1]